MIIEKKTLQDNLYHVYLCSEKEETFEMLNLCHRAQVELEHYIGAAQFDDFDLLPMSISALVNHVQGAILKSIDKDSLYRYCVYLCNDQDEAFSLLELCSQVQIELQQYLKFAQDNADVKMLLPNLSELSNRVQQEILGAMRSDRLIEEHIMPSAA